MRGDPRRFVDEHGRRLDENTIVCSGPGADVSRCPNRLTGFEVNRLGVTDGRCVRPGLHKGKPCAYRLPDEIRQPEAAHAA